MSDPTLPARARLARIPSAPALALAALACLLPTPALAGRLTVTNTDDALAGSLRQAVATSSPGDSIVFDPAVWGGTITLASGAIPVSHDLIVVGPQKRLVTIAAAAGDRAFTVSSGRLTLAGVTLTNPGVSAPASGGLLQTAGPGAALALTDCDLLHAAGPGPGGLVCNLGATTAVRCRMGGGTCIGARGGAVWSTGTFHATDCLFDSCIAGFGGAVAGTGKLRLEDCTFAGNQADTGLALALPAGADSASLLECTFSTNIGPQAAVANGGAVVVDVGSTIIAANGGSDAAGAFHSLGFNFIGDPTGSTGFSTAVHDQYGMSGLPITPGLAPLRDNGGPTLTLAPNNTSSAVVDRGHAMVDTLDACGRPRTYDDPLVFNATGGDGTDAGAVELRPRTHWRVTTTEDHGPGSLRAQAFRAARFDTVTFDPSVTGTIPLTTGEVLLPRPIYVIGPGPNALIVDGGGVRPALALPRGSSSVSVSALGLQNAGGPAGLEVDAGSSVTVDLLGITDCRTRGIVNAGALVVERSLVARCNATTGSGTATSNGGGLCNTGTMVVINSTFAADTALDGGGIANGPAPASIEIHNSTIARNVTVDGQPSARHGGGIVNSGYAYLASTLVAGNSAALGGPDLYGDFHSLGGFNLVGIGDGSTGFTNGLNHDQVGSAAAPLDAQLGPLADNGGPTPTLLPLAGSPAIDQGTSGSNATDQRERARTYDDPAVTNANDGSDVGACERGAATVDVGPAPGPAAGPAAVDRIDAVAPNPVVERCTVSFTLVRAGAVDLALFDVAGRRLATLAHGALAAGPHAVAWSDGDVAAGGARLAAGVYWLRLRTAAGAVARSLVRVR